MRFALTAALLACALTAQDRPDTVIRTTTRLVQIRVMADDFNGDPVRGLHKEDLTFLDNRKPQPIAFLVAEDGSAAAGAGRGISGRAEEVRDDYAVILIDWLNPLYSDRIKVRDYIDKLLRRFRPRQQVALYVLSTQPRMLHSFTGDPAQLLEALEATPIEPENPFDPSRPPISDPRYKTWLTLTPDERMFGFNNKIMDTVSTVGKVANSLARVPGRKSVIWVTNGFPIVLDGHAAQGAEDSVSYRKWVDPLIDSLNRANIAVYTVDARGLSTSGAYGDGNTLQELAERTGGSAFLSRNDLDEGMRLALEDTRTSYTLGFTVPADAVAGLHKIEVRTRRPGVLLRYRESYQLEGR